MLKIRITGLLSLLLLMPLFFQAQSNYSRVQIYANKTNYAQLGAVGIALDDAFFSKDYIVAELSDSEILKIQNAGFQTSILIDDVSNYYFQRNKNSDPAIKTDRTPANFNLGSMGGYLTNDEMIAELDEMFSLYPNLITEKQNIDGVNTTTEGNQIYVVKISDNPNVDEDEPEVLYTGMHHAREPVSMMHLIYYMWYLLENYEISTEVQYLVDNFEQFFIPIVNPDGYLYNQQTDPNGGGMFRKNRRDNGDGTFGVDINRNYPYQWAFDDSGSSGYPDDETYRGPSAGSEPEVQMMMNYCQTRNFLIANNHHTYSNLMLYPYGYDENAVNTEIELFEEYAHIMTRVNNFACGRAWELLYTVNGEANDWMYHELGMYAFTAETGTSTDGFWPSQDRIIPLCEQNLYMNEMMTILSGSYAEARDDSPISMKRNDFFNFKMTFLGLDTTATFKVYLSGDDIIYSDTAYFSEYSFMQIEADSLYYILSENVNYGDNFTFDIVVDNGLGSFKTPATKVLQKNIVVFDDDGDDLTNWTSTSWNITSEDYYSPSMSITDSPNSDYSDNSTTYIVSNSIDLSASPNAAINFYAKWDIESGWDYAQILISSNGGSTWTPLATENTVSGSGGVQPVGEPVFEGSNDWVAQSANISSYISNDVKIRFELGSDQSVTFDGFYFDDFQIVVTANNEAPVIVDQNSVNIPLNQTYDINFNDLVVTDADDTYPNGFGIVALAGDNYTLGSMPNQIIPNNDYSGMLTVPVKVNDGYEYSNVYDLQVNVTVGVDELQQTDINIFPNPASDFIQINSLNENIELVSIYDLNGRKIISQQINSSTSMIDVIGLKSGIYFVEVITNTQTQTQKLLIK